MSMDDLVRDLDALRDLAVPCADPRVAALATSLHELFLRVESWLEPGVRAGVFVVGRETALIEEQDFGAYTLPCMWIRALRSTIWFDPETARAGWARVSTAVPGRVGGRVRVTCDTMEYTLQSDDAGRWIIGRRRRVPRVLSQAVLADVLRDLLPDRRPLPLGPPQLPASFR